MLLYSGIYRRVVHMWIDLSDELITSISRVENQLSKFKPVSFALLHNIFILLSINGYNLSKRMVLLCKMRRYWRPLNSPMLQHRLEPLHAAPTHNHAIAVWHVASEVNPSEAGVRNELHGYSLNYLGNGILLFSFNAALFCRLSEVCRWPWLFTRWRWMQCEGG
jgi:hypothetical protein